MLRSSAFRCETENAWVVELPPSQLRILRIQVMERDLAASLGSALGCEWPLVPNTSASGKCDVLWLGPGEWLLAGGAEHLAEIVNASLNGHIFHLSDETDGRVTFRVEGPNVRALLAKGCSLDLHSRVFSSGRCAQTLLAQVPVLIHYSVDDTTFDVIVDASFGAYLKTWFADACAGGVHSE